MLIRKYIHAIGSTGKISGATEQIEICDALAAAIQAINAKVGVAAKLSQLAALPICRTAASFFLASIEPIIFKLLAVAAFNGC